MRWIDSPRGRCSRAARGARSRSPERRIFARIGPARSQTPTASFNSSPGCNTRGSGRGYRGSVRGAPADEGVVHVGSRFGGFPAALATAAGSGSGGLRDSMSLLTSWFCAIRAASWSWRAPRFEPTGIGSEGASAAAGSSVVPPVASSDDATAAEVSGSGISASVEATATRETRGAARARPRAWCARGRAARRSGGAAARRRRGAARGRAGRHEGRAEPRRRSARRRRFKEATESGACFVATRRDRARGGTAASGVRPGARALAGGRGAGAWGRTDACGGAAKAASGECSATRRGAGGGRTLVRAVAAPRRRAGP